MVSFRCPVGASLKFDGCATWRVCLPQLLCVGAYNMSGALASSDAAPVDREHSLIEKLPN